MKENHGVHRIHDAYRAPVSLPKRVLCARCPRALAGVSLTVVVGGLMIALAGCGGSTATSAAVAQAQIREARKAGEEAVHEKDRVDSLERQVRRLNRQIHHQRHSRPAAVAPDASAPTPTPAVQDAEVPAREFHVASGNVSCEVRADGAICTVEPISETFSFGDGEAGHSESGVALPEDLGEVVPYGTTIVVGSVRCEVPPSSVPRGIVCGDADTGHGFEASRVASRQKIY